MLSARSSRSSPATVIRILLMALIGLLSAEPFAVASEVRVMISGGFSGSYNALAPTFAMETGDTLVTIRGPSMGLDPTSIPQRLSRGERADVVIMVRSALDQLVAKGAVKRGSISNLGIGLVAAAVKAGAPRPDISTVAALRETLLAAKSIAYSDSASGVYLSTILFKRLGIADEMKAKAKMIQATPVALYIAHGDYELGFQQLSELKAIPGIAILGTIPNEVQQRTLFAAGVVKTAANPAGAEKLIAFLKSKKVQPVLKESGLATIN